MDSEQGHGLQVLLDDGVHDDLENDLHVGGVGGCGEVVVDQFAGGGVERHEHRGDEPGASVHITVSSCQHKHREVFERRPRLHIYSKNSNVVKYYSNLNR